MNEFIVDLHCHIVPYVDDGASVLEEALFLVESQYAQGVRTICATPHLRASMFESSDEEIIRQFGRLKEMAEERFPDLTLFLSREYHCDRLLREHLKKDMILPLGYRPGENREKGALLIEFSGRHTWQQMEEYIELVQSFGFVPVIAHVERYPAAGSKEKVRALAKLGARIQVNAGSILGRDGLKTRFLVRSLLKENLVDVVASDCHDTEDRPCELQAAYYWIKEKYGASYAAAVLRDNPRKLLAVE
ncbi:MAG: hypothetical protein IJM83_09465 [Firmicutes bacterium]|nr:hypothetical protein [Bacillota bacterium]